MRFWDKASIAPNPTKEESNKGSFDYVIRHRPSGREMLNSNLNIPPLIIINESLNQCIHTMPGSIFRPFVSHIKVTSYSMTSPCPGLALAIIHQDLPFQ